MLLRYFGLNEDPFGVTPEPRYLFQSSSHREAFASLKYGFYANRGFTALIAPPGLGKTTLLYCFLTEIRESARSVFLFDLDSQCEPRDLIASILHDLGIEPAKSSAEMHEQLNAVLVQESRAGRTVAVVIDEAQNLSDAALETVRLLSNFETPRAKLIHIVLSGQPQLSEKLMRPSLVQLRQRITTICRIAPLSIEETKAYIDHRLMIAGYRGEPLFAPDALNSISQASHGIPRTINNLCFNAVSICRALNCRQVTASMVEEAIVDLDLMPAVSERNTPASTPASIGESEVLTRDRTAGSARRWRIAAAAILAVPALGTLGYAGTSILRAHQAELRPAHPAPLQNDAADAQKSAPADKSDPVADSRKFDEFSAGKPEKDIRAFKVTVGRNQTLREIALQYLGDFNEARLHQIRMLNPSLVNPNHIVLGQSLWLPGPPPARLTVSAVTSTDARSLP